MNERIKELWTQGTFNVVPRTGDYSSVSAEQIERFARLIVRECVQSIEKTIETNCDTDSEKMGCEFAITDMLEHFGVEE